MLAEASRRNEAEGAQVTFVEQDMRRLDFGSRSFDAVLSLFDSIGYSQTNEGLSQVLTGAHRHLRKGGLILLEFWHAAAMLRSYEPIRLRRWRISDREIVRISETRLDHVHQLANVTYTIMDIADDGAFRQLKETQTNRYFLAQEMLGCLESNGFTPIESFAGFNRERGIDGDTWHIVTLAQKRR
jgi:SAM-dependent methyltransferase